MKYILCYGDSNTWGFDPVHSDPEQGRLARYPEGIRWTTVLQARLGAGWRVGEEGLCGRTTVFEDPVGDGRHGLEHLRVALESCMPLDYVLFMLGTNDTKDMYQASAPVISCGMERLVDDCRSFLRDRGMGETKIILLCPPIVRPDGKGNYLFFFSSRSTQTGEELRDCYRELAARKGYIYLDVNELICTDPADGVHLSGESHRVLGEALAERLAAL